MACFTTEYILHTNNPSVVVVDNCQIDQDIWVVERLTGHKFKMFKWNIYSKQIHKIDFKNRYLIECNNGLEEYEKDFTICSSNGKLYMWREHFNFSRLLEFDPTTLEWKILKSVEWKPVPTNFSIVNNEVYISYGCHIVRTFSINEDRSIIYNFSIVSNGIQKEMSFCNMNDAVYFTHIPPNGTRGVAKYNREISKFGVLANYDKPRCYLEHTGSGEYHPHTYGYNNKMYQLIQSKDRIILDCFDIETKKFHTMFETKHTGIDVINMCGTDKKSYVVYSRNGTVAIRVIDMKPTFEKISLVSVADQSVCTNSIEVVRNILPYTLRPKFENMVRWKMTEMTKFNSQKC